MNDGNENAPAASETPDAAVPYEKQHTGVGFTLYLALGLIALTVLMLVLAIAMIGFTGPLGEP